VVLRWKIPFSILFSAMLVFTPFDLIAEPTCNDLFMVAPEESRVSLSNFEAIIHALDTGSADSVRIIHENFLEIVRDPLLRQSLPHLIRQLQELRTRAEDFSASGNRQIEQSIVLARLAQGDLMSWKTILTAPGAATENFFEFGISGTMGYLLKNLSSSQKTELLSYLGESYHKKKNRGLVLPIHILLDPKAMYEKFRREGKSDLNFYESYLRRIHDTVFKGKSTGDYSASLVINIAKLIQASSLHDGLREVNFFGSVVNGFGKPESDLDVFDSPRTLSVAEILKREDEGDFRHLDLFNHRRTLIADIDLNRNIRDYLANSPWHWKIGPLIENGVAIQAEEHLGGLSHVFSFHISKQKITLRFYPDSIGYDEHAQLMPQWNYIELDVLE
jgi:hypothetical protein